MKYTDFEYRLDCALGLVAEGDRRDFLKTMGRAGAGLATGGGPVGVLAKGLVGDIGGGSRDPFADISDNELIKIPEKEWMNIIPTARLARIFSIEEYDPNAEIVSKLCRVINYGIKYMAVDKSLQMMKDAMEKHGIDPKRSLFKALTNRDNRQIFTGTGDAGKSASNAINALERVGIKVPDDIKRLTFENAKKTIDLQNEQDNKQIRKYEEIDKQNKKDNDLKYNTARMHQPFEARLEKALMSVMG